MQMRLQTIKNCDETYEEMKSLYRKDRKLFYRTLKTSDETELMFLYYYCRFACETYKEYKRRGIADHIFWNTFLDIRIWSDDYFRKTGKIGLDLYVHDWFWRSFELKLFRLGRLEFEEMEAEEELQGLDLCIERGEKVISIHIPEGEPLTMISCEESLKQAFHWYGRERKYFCHSWLLFPGLRTILPDTSNILDFHRFFDIVKTDYREREAEQRIYGNVKMRIADYDEKTTLQKKAKQFLLKGGSLGNGWGILKDINFE